VFHATRPNADDRPVRTPTIEEVGGQRSRRAFFFNDPTKG
jgi:hypothetical protein